MKPIDVAVVTGGHWFDVRGFHHLFRTLPGINAYIQHMEDFGSSTSAERGSYAVVVFYGMPLVLPEDHPKAGAREKPLTALQQLTGTGQGILILHHALMAYPSWSLWDNLVGLSGRDKFGYDDDQDFEIRVADSRHPITRGLGNWQMHDETYLLPEPGAGSTVLLSTDYARSMKAIGWVRQVERARVFNFQSGHDRQAWENPNFRAVLERGIAWCAGGTAQVKALV